MFRIKLLLFYIFYCGIKGSHSMKNINECLSGKSVCGASEICVDMRGGFRCQCPPDWIHDITKNRCVPNTKRRMQRESDENIPTGFCIKINDEKIEPIGLYTFFPGELVHIRLCQQFDNGYILLVTPDGVTERAAGKQGLLVKMTPQHNGSYIHCEHITGNATLILGDNIAEYHLIVNGIALKPTYNTYFLQNRHEHLFLKLNKKFNGTVDIKGMNSILSDVIWDGQKALELIPLVLDKMEIFFITITEQLLYERNEHENNTMFSHLNIKSFNLEVSRTFLFDPIITGLEVSKILARYLRSPVTNVIKYELDVEDNEISMTCSSRYGNVNSNGKTSKQNKWLLFTKTTSGTYHRVMNCSVFHNNLLFTTLLDITKAKRSNTSVPRIGSHKLLPGTSQNSSTIKHLNDNTTEELDNPMEEMAETTTTERYATTLAQAKLSKEVASSVDEAPSNFQMLIVSNLATMLATAVIMAIIFTVYLKCRQRDQGADDTPDPLAPLYEPIYYSTCKSGTEEETVDISQRPQEPIPADDVEEDGKYIHYDTPYDHRFDRRMNARFGK